MTEVIGDPGWYVDSTEVRSLYTGHEVASHTVNHPDLTQLDSEAIRNEVARDVELLESLSSEPVESLAYPFGIVDDKVVAAMAGIGITNARTVDSTLSFSLPDDLLRWNPTAHHSEALDLADGFLNENDGSPALFFIWGHSWEFDGDAPGSNWETVDRLCETLSGRDDVWYAGAGEFARYLIAVMNLRWTGSEWSNPSSVSVWIRDNDEFRELPPDSARTGLIRPRP